MDTHRITVIILGSVAVAALTLAFVEWYITKKKELSLYDRLGGVFAIAAVIDHFSDALISNPIVGKNSPNPYLREWCAEHLDRLPGLKFMRTLWLCAISGGPFVYTPTRAGKCPFSLENAHSELHISSSEFDEVARVLSSTLDYYKVPPKEKGEVLSVFAAHKREVIGN